MFYDLKNSSPERIEDFKRKGDNVKKQKDDKVEARSNLFLSIDGVELIPGREEIP